MFAAIGTFIAGIFGGAAGGALAVGITTALTVASTMYSAVTMFKGIEEGNIGKAILGGIGAFAGISSLSSMASASVSASAKTASTAASSSPNNFSDLTKSDMMTDSGFVVDSPPITESVIGTEGLNTTTTSELARVGPDISQFDVATEAVEPLMDGKDRLTVSPSLSEQLAKEPLKVSPTKSSSTSFFNDAAKKLLPDSILDKTSGLDDILNNQGLRYGLQYLGARRQQDLLQKLKEQEMADYNERKANLNSKIDIALFR